METVASMGNEDLEMSEQVRPAAYINHNAYLKNAPAFDAEKENYTSAADPQVKISVEGEGKLSGNPSRKRCLVSPPESSPQRNTGYGPHSGSPL